MAEVGNYDTVISTSLKLITQLLVNFEVAFLFTYCL